MVTRSPGEVRKIVEGMRPDIYEGSVASTLTAAEQSTVRKIIRESGTMKDAMAATGRSEKAIRTFANEAELSFAGKRGRRPGSSSGHLSEEHKAKISQTMRRRRDEAQEIGNE